MLIKYLKEKKKKNSWKKEKWSVGGGGPHNI